MKKVAFVGIEGSGRTTLATALSNLFHEHAQEGWYLRPDSRDAFSLQEQLKIPASQSSVVNQSTPLKYLSWSVQFNNQTVGNFDVLDYPGEIYRLAFLDALDESNSAIFSQRKAECQDEIHAMLEHIAEAEHVFVLFNLEKSSDLPNNASTLEKIWITNACLDFLHKLPSHPEVTLLLTQVDKYTDVTKYELDPEVYIEHHLPLIYKQFPNLDVMAVSALVEANTLVGLDNVLCRCLFSSEVVQGIVNQLKRLTEQINTRLDKLTIGHLTASDSTFLLNKMAECRDLIAKLPWFVSLEYLIANKLCVNFDVMKDVMAEIRILSLVDMSHALDEQLRFLRISRKKMLEFEPETIEGTSFKTNFLEDIDKGTIACKNQIEKRKRWRKYGIITIATLAVVAVLEVLIIFWRMAE